MSSSSLSSPFPSSVQEYALTDNALHLDPALDYIQLSVQNVVHCSHFTLQFWIKLNLDPAAEASLFSQLSGCMKITVLNDAGSEVLRWYKKEGDPEYSQAQIDYQWRYWSFVNDPENQGQENKIYVDAGIQTSQSILYGATFCGGTQVYLGYDQDGDYYMSKLGMWNVPLNENQIFETMNK